MPKPKQETASTLPDDPQTAALIAALQAQVQQLQQSVAQAKSEAVVKLTYISAVSEDNVLDLGDFGTLNGVGGCLEIPRRDFGGRFMTPFVRKLLAKRRLIVMDGLSREEQQRYGVDYRAGEVLDMQAFDRLLHMPQAQLIQIFGALCAEHQQLVATRLITAFTQGDHHVSRPLVTALNDLSKQNDSRGLLHTVLEQMNRQDL